MSWLSSHISAFTAAAGQCVCVCVCVSAGRVTQTGLTYGICTHTAGHRSPWQVPPTTASHTLRRRTVCVHVLAEMRSGTMGVRLDI